MDAELILAIVVNTEGEDFLAWHHDNKGMFSVKSAYHVLKDHDQELKAMKQMGESSSGTRVTRLKWCDIWKKKANPKYCNSHGDLHIIVWQ